VHKAEQKILSCCFTCYSLANNARSCCRFLLQTKQPQ